MVRYVTIAGARSARSKALDEFESSVSKHRHVAVPLDVIHDGQRAYVERGVDHRGTGAGGTRRCARHGETRATRPVV